MHSPLEHAQGIGVCPVAGCQFTTDEKDATIAVHEVVQHLYVVHEGGTDYEADRARFMGGEAA